MNSVLGRVGWLDGGAAVLAVATCWAVVTMIDDRGQGFAATAVIGLGVFVIGHLLGWRPLMVIATVPMFGPVVANVMMSTEQTWYRSLIVGCLWFATIEISLAAIDARALRHNSNATDHIGAHISDVDARASARGRAMDHAIEVLTVVGMSAAMVLAAAAATLVAPQRTAVALAFAVGLITVGILAAGRVVSSDSESVSENAHQRPPDT